MRGVNTAACLRTTAAVLNLGLSGQPSAKQWVRAVREQTRKRFESWSHHSGLAGMGTQGAFLAADQTSHRKSAFGSPVWTWPVRGVRKTGKTRELPCWFLKGETSYGNSDDCTAEYSPAAVLFPSPPSVLPHTCLLPVNVFSACAPTARQLNTLMVDAKGRNMKCLTFFLMLPESVKSKSSKSSKKGNASGGSKLPPVCYEIITLRSKKKKKMAADIFPTKKPASTTTVQQYQQQNLNNNNTIQNCNWQGLYSTIRER